MTLDDLHRAYPAPQGPRVVLHRGSCGDAVDAGRHAAELRRAVGDALVDGACDGACWAAPAATVVRPHVDGPARGATDRATDAPAHVHRFARLDQEGAEAMLACLGGACAEPGNERGGLLGRMGRGGGTLGDALAGGAYAAAARALAMPSGAVIGAVEALGLTGRGGAHFPTGRKWRFAAARERPLLVVNAEEGEPGVFKDRHLLEGDPHRLIEGMVIAAHAIGCREAYVYVNGQAQRARQSLERALAGAADAGILGGDALGAAVELAVEVRSGAGGYVCGEETVILNSIEGERPVPRFKPPQITEAGLFGRPTLLNNVETLVAATQLFDPPPAPRKLIPLSGAVPRPGLYEVAVDGEATWATLLAWAGVAPTTVRALLVGGPSGVFVPREAFETPLEMSALGSGGTVALSEATDIAAVVHDLARYNARESCGECTPCREGTQRLVELLEAPVLDRERAEGLIEVLAEASLCQLGGMAGRPLASALAAFPGAFEVTP